jgi:putative endonuclease
MVRGGVVYILTNNNHSTLYTGVTANLRRRLYQHRNATFSNSFTARYALTKLVYYSAFSLIEDAIAEEKRIKGGSRVKKLKLIESLNPQWKDLAGELENW